MAGWKALPLVAALFALGAAPPVVAQTDPSKGAGSGSRPSSSSPGETGGPPKPAQRVLNAAVVKLHTLLPSAVVVGVGQFPAAGWSDATLLQRVNASPPADGIYEFDLVATPPANLSTFVLTFRTAILEWPELPADAKGVRIHAEGNAVVAPVMDASRAAAR